MSEAFDSLMALLGPEPPKPPRKKKKNKNAEYFRRIGQTVSTKEIVAKMPNPEDLWRFDATVIFVRIQTCSHCNSVSREMHYDQVFLRKSKHHKDPSSAHQYLPMRKMDPFKFSFLPRIVEEVHSVVGACPSCFIPTQIKGFKPLCESKMLTRRLAISTGFTVKIPALIEGGLYSLQLPPSAVLKAESACTQACCLPSTISPVFNGRLSIQNTCTLPRFEYDLPADAMHMLIPTDGDQGYALNKE